MDTKELRFKDEVFAIVGAAIEVHRALGPGFLEAVYAEAFAKEMTLAGVPFEQEVLLQIHHKGEPLKKTYRATSWPSESSSWNSRPLMGLAKPIAPSS